MITPRQIRAARALLGIDGTVLAEATGVTRATITNIENDIVQPREGTMERLMRAFTERGIEFVGERGVALVNDNYRMIEGADCYLRLLDEIFHALRGKSGAEALFICVDDAKSPPAVTEANQRLRTAGIKCRCLASEKAKRFDFPLREYRLLPAKLFRNSVMIVYGNKVATLRGVNGAVLVINDKDQAEMLRGLFEMIWTHAPPPGKAAS